MNNSNKTQNTDAENSHLFQWVKNFLSSPIERDENGRFGIKTEKNFFRKVYTFSEKDSSGNKGTIFFGENFSLLLEMILLGKKDKQHINHVKELNDFFTGQGMDDYEQYNFHKAEDVYLKNGADSLEQSQVWRKDQEEIHQLYQVFLDYVKSIYDMKCSTNSSGNLMENAKFLGLAEKTFAEHWNGLDFQAKSFLMEKINIKKKIGLQDSYESLELLFRCKFGDQFNEDWHAGKCGNDKWQPPKRPRPQEQTKPQREATAPKNELCRMSMATALSLMLCIVDIFFWFNRFFRDFPCFMAFIFLEMLLSHIIARHLFKDRSLIVLSGGFLSACSLAGLLPMTVTCAFLMTLPLFGHFIAFGLRGKMEAWMLVGGGLHVVVNELLIIYGF